VQKEAVAAGLVIKKSNITGANLGVFASVDIPAGHLKLWYWGGIVAMTKLEVMAASEDEVGDRLLCSKFRVPGPQPCSFVHVAGSEASAATYINSSETDPNVKFVEREGKIKGRFI
jgi:hypothetical protein